MFLIKKKFAKKLFCNKKFCQQKNVFRMKLVLEMPLLDQKPDQIAFFIFSFAALNAYFTGGGFADNAVLGSAALFFTIPRMAVETVFQSAPLLAPLAVLAFFWIFVAYKNHLGEAIVAASVMGAIALMAGV